MKVMILAAGRGERMRPLTDHTPKPLISVAGKPMIEHTIASLKEAGFTDIVINLAHLGAKIEKALVNGSRFGINIQYSHEGNLGLETAGGICHALPLLGKDPFLVVNGDIATDFPYATLKNKAVELAHLILIENPEHHQEGDFGLENGIISTCAKIQYTFSGIGIYTADLFIDCPPGKALLGPLLRKAMASGKVTGSLFKGFWMDVGTPQRLKELDQYYSNKKEAP
jgi:N-acetyl-alpha-D-muramate 1-phosphate uridylyltransferase